MCEHQATFRFYEELNDFLPPVKRKATLVHFFNGSPSVKDAIEALGVPHTDVDLIVANGNSVGFDYHVKEGDRVAVYPVFESLDISPIIRLRGEPLRKTAFILDVHLGKLARRLRMLGFDVMYRTDYDDPEIIRIGVEEHRIILTRDRRLLQARIVTHGYWVRSQNAEEQVAEVLRRFDLHDQINTFSRCLSCNGIMSEVDKAEVEEKLEPKTRLYYDRFYRCSSCGKIYWEGSHMDKLRGMIEKLTNRNC
jgi:uncharacterized protein with PIN domain